jgi:hypothetical protein
MKNGIVTVLAGAVMAVLATTVSVQTGEGLYASHIAARPREALRQPERNGITARWRRCGLTGSGRQDTDPRQGRLRALENAAGVKPDRGSTRVTINVLGGGQMKSEHPHATPQTSNLTVFRASRINDLSRRRCSFASAVKWPCR